jgi:branched-chain amino acid transport system ATP-binding protein
MLEVEELTLAYGEIEAVTKVSFAVPEAQFVSVLGRNGAGKTTTLKGLMGIIPCKSGAVRLNGMTISGRTPSDISRRGVAYVPEGRGIFTTLTVTENLAAAAYGSGLRRSDAKKRIDRYQAVFPILGTRSSVKAGMLSGGEQQMLALARALISGPSFLLLDEPGLGLAPIIVQNLYEHFRELNREQGMALLVVEQYVNLAIRNSTMIYVLEKGRLVYQSAPQDVGQEVARVAEFIS